MAISKATLVLVTTLLFLLAIPESSGYLQGRTSSSIQITSGQWGARVGGTSGAITTSPYVVTWTANTKKQYALIAIENIGSYPLNVSHLSLSSAKSNGDTTNPPTLTFEKCSGVWNTTDFSCNGSTTTIASASVGQIDITENILAGSKLIIRITNLRDVNSNYTTTLNAITSRNDIRVGQVFSS